jgi:DNA-binding NarL/FixJ family response regulator
MRNALAAPSKPVNVLLCDSSRMETQLLADAFLRDPQFHVLTCLLEEEALLAAVASFSPGHLAVLCLSGSFPADALSALRALHQSHPLVGKILLVDAPERDLVIAAFRAGARGIFSLADHPFDDLCKCILRVASGQVWISTPHLDFLLGLITGVPTLMFVDSLGRPLLSPRQEQVVSLVAEGLSNRQVAVQLSLSEHTIKKYLFRIFEKLGISTRVELVLYAVSQTDSHRGPISVVRGALGHP